MLRGRSSWGTVGTGRSMQTVSRKHSECPCDTRVQEGREAFRDQVSQLVREMRHVPVSKPRPGVRRRKVSLPT